MRRQRHAAVGDGAEGAHDLDHGDREALAEGHRAGGGAVVVLEVADDARDLPGEVDAGRLADPVALDALREGLRADHVLHELGEGGVGGADEHVAHAHVHGVVAPVDVGDVVGADLHLGGDGVDGVLGEQPLLDADRGREHLEDRARLEGARDELEVERRGVLEVREVGQRGGAGREHLAGQRVGHHDRAGVRQVGVDRLRDGALADLLEVRVDRDDEVGAVAGLRDRGGAARDRGPVEAGLHDHLAVGAGEDVIVVELEAGQAVAVRAHVADDLRPDRPVGIDALSVRHEVDAGELAGVELVAQLVCDLLVDLALDVDEGRVLGEEVHVVALVAAQRADEQRRHARGVRDRLGVGVDRLALDAHRQRVAVAVVDRAALCVQRHRVGSLRLGG